MAAYGHLTAKITAGFSFSVYSSVDKDMVLLDNSQHQRKVELDVELLVTFSGDFETDEWGVSDVEISSTPDSIDFDYAGPDFREDDYDL